MALHEIHWNPHTRAMVLVRNHGSGPDNGCGFDGEEVRDVEALTVAFLSEGGSLDGWDDINEVVSIDGPIEIAGDWYAADDNGTLFRVTAWCSLGELAEWGTIEDHLLDAEWVGHRGTIPVCEVVRFSCVEGPSIDAIGPIGGMVMIARQRNGRFGPQVRTEPDPANAGLGEPEAPLPTWEEALAHAEVLRAQGVDVSIDEGQRSIEIFGTNGKYHDPADETPAIQEFYPDGTPKVVERYTNGKRHDPADGTPAYQCFYPDGTPKLIIRYTNGERHDPADGTPASQCFHPDGTPMWISHYTDGWRHDPADGTPAFQWFYSDGTPMTISHYTDGELVSEESFPPPTGKS